MLCFSVKLIVTISLHYITHSNSARSITLRFLFWSLITIFFCIITNVILRNIIMRRIIISITTGIIATSYTIRSDIYFDRWWRCRGRCYLCKMWYNFFCFHRVAVTINASMLFVCSILTITTINVVYYRVVSTWVWLYRTSLLWLRARGGVVRWVSLEKGMLCCTLCISLIFIYLTFLLLLLQLLQLLLLFL